MNYKALLRDEREIADYIESISSEGVDRELIEETFFGCSAELKLVSISSLNPGPSNQNVPNQRKQAIYNKLPAEEAPPILVEEGRIWDGHHRHRSAKSQGLESIWAYVVSDGTAP